MENPLAGAIPQIPSLIGHENLDEWKLQVINVFKFYDMEDDISQEDAPPRKRKRRAAGVAPFLLGLLTASVAPVASRLLKAGWNFSKPNQDPVDLYEQTLKIILPPSELSRVASTALRDFLMAKCYPRYGLRDYQKTMEYLKRRLNALGCPMDGNLAVCVVLNALEKPFPELWQQLVEDMSAGGLTWSKLMEKIAKEASDCST